MAVCSGRPANRFFDTPGPPVGAAFFYRGTAAPRRQRRGTRPVPDSISFFMTKMLNLKKILQNPLTLGEGGV